jgi:mRNA interferase MazF
MQYRAGLLCMGQYVKGDVLLANVALDDRTASKIRPVVVVRTEASGTIHCCPVSSKPPSDAPCLPLSIDDFTTGGLDLFGDSYVMTSRVLRLPSGAVIGKKGRLSCGSLAEITAQVPADGSPGTGPGAQSRNRR